jgi:hypothetical protein
MRIMTTQNPHISRRTVFRTVAGTALAGLAGCLGDSDSGTPDNGTDPLAGQDQIERVAVEGTTLVVELSEGAEVDQINLIEPNGEFFGQRKVATGAQQVSFDLRTSYVPGEYRIVALNGGETEAEVSTEIRPEIQILDVGLFRNNPDKPWDEVYGESPTDSKKNGEAFVTVQNTGSGPDAIVELRFTGDVPNPVEDPRGGGIYEEDHILISAGETVDLFSDSFPFGSEIGGMGCSTDGNSGQFTVVLETQNTGQQVTKAFDVRYTDSSEMYDCEISINEA